MSDRGASFATLYPPIAAIRQGLIGESRGRAGTRGTLLTPHDSSLQHRHPHAGDGATIPIERDDSSGAVV